jgi:signal transduction histidine kinase/ligand-binding sensor domain-containing protein
VPVPGPDRHLHQREVRRRHIPCLKLDHAARGRRVSATAIHVLFALVACAHAAAEPQPVSAHSRYRVASWTTAEGLPQNTVNDIALLPNGELWLATFGGLARFDGRVFRVLDIAGNAGLPDNRIVAIRPDGRDAFWFLTHRGHLGRVRDGRADVVVRPPSPPLETLSLLVDDQQRGFATATDGSVWVGERGDTWRQIIAGHRTVGSLRGLATTATRETWMSAGDRLIRWHGDSAATTIAVKPDDYHLFPRRGGGLWVGTIDGLYQLAGDRLESVVVRPRLAAPVTAAEEDGPDALWVATRDSVSRLARQPDGRWRREAVPLPAPPAAGYGVRSLRPDGRGGVWVGTTGFGLLHVRALPVQRLGAEAGLHAVAGLAPDGAGGAFLLDWCRGLVHVDRSAAVSRIVLRDPADPNGNASAGCSMAIAATRPGHVWVRVEDRLFSVWRESLRVSRVAVRLPAEEGPIVADGQGRLWVISRRGLVQQFSPAGVETRRWSLEPPLVSASMAPDGALWIGGAGRIVRVAGDRVETIGADQGMPRADVRDVHVDADGTAWIALYGGGIVRLAHGRVSQLSVAHGLPDNGVSRILADARGRLWFSTNRGLAVVDRGDLVAVADGRRRSVAPVVFGPERGVDEATFGTPAGFADPSGVLWFGVISGAVAIDSSRFPFDAAPPLARVESIVADDLVLAPAGTVRVPAGTVRLRLEFSSSNLAYPERARFRFRDAEFDRDWVDTGTQHTIDWTPPTPGRHRLLVGARNEDGVWSATPAEVIVDVEPRWWQTDLARVAALVAGALTIVVVYHRRERGIERRHTERLRLLEDQRAAEQRVADVRVQLDHVSRVAMAGEMAASLAHEVSQPLSAMVNNAEAGRRLLAQGTPDRGELSELLDDVLADGMRASQVVRSLRAFVRPRRPELGAVDVSAVVREMLPLVERELRDNKVVLDLSLTDPLPPIDGVHVQIGQVVVNLVKNACEALAGVPGERRISVSTAVVADSVQLEVRDNGPGLADEVASRVFDPFVTTKPEGLGMGLAICRAIAEAHGGNLTMAPATPGLSVMFTVPVARQAGAS